MSTSAFTICQYVISLLELSKDPPSGPTAILSGPTILLFNNCWADLSLVLGDKAPVNLGAFGILQEGSQDIPQRCQEIEFHN